MPAVNAQICDAFSTKSDTSQVTVSWDSRLACLPDTFTVTLTSTTDDKDIVQCDITDSPSMIATTECTRDAVPGRTYNIVVLNSGGQTISPSPLHVTASKYLHIQKF